ncbi:hypothetical protein FKX85_09540 [Echinicola soli]|uniref:Uncharacterized protein n=1 Tax=Echinicola soli TaxID=2591634 RepID=A0A514CHF8_9BACT|nr:hypothetical protein [Echinicola soli]QDH79261.1 hypothetical protein FKX85_09540 [Echinicola soli]
MRKAYENLKIADPNGRMASEDISITATHLYLRFIPKNEKELDILNSDSTLVLYSYPLDYEIPEGGEYYRDPEVPEGQPTYQYCAVPVDKELTEGVEYEVLEELYIPEELPASPGARQLIEVSIDALVDEALRITGNLEEKDKRDNPAVQRKKWRPAGRITLYDKELGGYVGVHGVEVRARRWFTTHKGYTSSNGYYSCDGTFKRRANYSLRWERYDFEIRSGDKPGSETAEVNGPKITEDWNLNISASSDHWMYALVFQASHDYYYGNRLGLKSPPTNSFWKTKVKIAAYNRRNEGASGRHCKDCRFLGLSSRIKIWENTDESSRIYATTLHELAHASHWELRKNNWNNNTDDKVQESWARGVQWALGRLRYPNYKGRERSFDDYTLVVADMNDDVDSNNTNYGFGYLFGETQDQVSGYTIKQIEDVLSYTSTWNDWKNNIKNRYTNGPENNLDALFAAYNK